AAEAILGEKIVSTWSAVARRLRTAPQAGRGAAFRFAGGRARRNRLRVRERRKVSGIPRWPRFAPGFAGVGDGPRIRRNAYSAKFRAYPASWQASNFANLGTTNGCLTGISDRTEAAALYFPACPPTKQRPRPILS